MSEFNPKHLYIVLSHMLRTPAIADLACKALDSEHLRHDAIGGSIFQGLLFHVIKKYKEEFNKVPDDAALEAEFETLVRKYAPAVEILAEFTENIRQFLTLKNNAIGPNSEPLARKLIKRIAEICVVLPKYKETLTSALESGVIGGLSTKLAEIESKHASLSGGMSICGLSSLPHTELGERVVTGIPWIDSRLGAGAGPVRGCTAAIIAPQGTGKTTLGISIAVMQALEGKHALLVLGEEGLTTSMRAKIFGAALGIPYGHFVTTKFDLAKAIELGKVEPPIAAAKIARLDQFLHILDIAHDHSGMDVIDGEIQHLKNQGCAPVYVYIDWAGIIALRFQDKYKGITEALHVFASTLTNWSQRDNSIIFISQQMGQEDIKKGPFAIHGTTCAENCKGFTQTMKYVFVLGPKDPKTGFSVCGIPKARDDVPGERIIVKLEGEYPRFSEHTAKYDITKKAFKVRAPTVGSNSIPSGKG